MSKYCNEWVDIPNKFDKINIDTYKFSISEAKEKHKSAISESSSITDRTLTIIKVFIPLSSLTIGYMLKSEGVSCIMTIYIAFSAALLIIGFLILKSKSICEVGQKPDDFFLDYLDDEENTEIEKEKSIKFIKEALKDKENE